MDTESLNRVLECVICLETLDISNKVLPCQHTFCRKCLVKIVDRNKELRCPECRILINSRIDDLPPNVFVVRLLEMMKAKSKNSRPVRESPDNVFKRPREDSPISRTFQTNNCGGVSVNSDPVKRVKCDRWEPTSTIVCPPSASAIQKTFPVNINPVSLPQKRGLRKIWEGFLEWDQMPVPKAISCEMWTILCNGQPEIEEKDWPHRLSVEPISKSIFELMGSWLYRNKKVLFFFEPGAGLTSFLEPIKSGAALVRLRGGCNTTIKNMVLVHSGNNPYFGYIPSNQIAFNNHFVTSIRRCNQMERSLTWVAPMGQCNYIMPVPTCQNRPSTFTNESQGIDLTKNYGFKYGS